MNRQTLLTLGIVGLALAVALVAAGMYVFQQEAAQVADLNAQRAVLREQGNMLGDGPDAPVDVSPWSWAAWGAAVVCAGGAGVCLYWVFVRLRPPAPAAPEGPDAEGEAPRRRQFWKRRDPVNRS